MCGIAGVYLRDPSIVDTENDRIQFDRMVDELMLGIESRGRDATGFVAANGMTVQLDKKDVPASQFIKTRRRSWMDKGTRMVLCHTRLATQGHQSRTENNHPVTYGSTFVTHNGHIHNDDVVYKELDLERYAEVDSSAIAASLHHYGFDKAKDALEKLGGAFAIAAIDPVKSKDTLLLAKGPSYPPLAYYETKHLIMWASLKDTIQSAFETVLGHKPALADIKTLNTGDAIWIRDGELELSPKFFTPRTSYTTYSYTSSWDRNWAPTGGSTSGSRTYSSARGVTTVLDLKEHMRKLRQSGNGRAITFDRKDRMTAEQRKLHNNKWVVCLHCNDTVADMCMINHSKWSEICWDCLAEGMLRENRKQNETAPKGAVWCEMEDGDFDEMEDFASTDMAIVEQVINKMSEDLGISYTTIAWLLFYTNYIQAGAGTEALKERLFEVYTDYENRFYESSLAERNDASEVDIIIPPERQLMAGDKPQDEIPTVLGKCDHCRKKAKVFYMGHRWCNRHWESCMTRACKNDPVGYGPDGKMHCHGHSRGVKGLKYLEKATA